MRFLMLLLFASTAAVCVSAQSEPPVDSRIVLEVSIASNQREFRIGETIPLKLAFSSNVKDRYQINMAQYDRSGRMNYEQFDVSPAESAVDPLPTYNGSMGGLTNFKYLVPEPWTIKLNLNEWVRFTQPGEYRIAVSSNRVGVRDPSTALGTSPVTARSNEIVLKIISASPAWQKQVLRDAVAVIDAPAPAKRDQMEQYTASRRQALETIRFLGTADAARELAKRMRGEDSGGFDYVCMLGLISSPERGAARSALEAALADPDHPIDGNFLYALRMIRSEPSAPASNWQEARQKVLGELLAALPGKRGNALSISLSTALNESWNGNEPAGQTTDQLASQLVSMFDQLPLSVQSTLLTYRWEKIKSPAMLPILRRYAQSYKDFPQMRDANADGSLELSASALRHWYELDPAGARPAIIAEITRPRPRYDARVLGILPDETLPEVDSALAEHLAASHDLDGSSNLASLISRYATDATLPQIIEQVDPKIGTWACAIQDPLLAYVLRVNPALARPRIMRAIAARGPEFTGCNHELFHRISEIRYDPVLEEIGIQSLDDPDPEVPMTAATMLGSFGSPAVESALLQRYSRWCTEWIGRESELNITLADSARDRQNELGLGENLMRALAVGKSWLSDKARLQHLSELTKVRRIQEQLDGYLKIWQGQPFTIFVSYDSAAATLDSRVAQYEFHSLEALKEKLAQFPAGTKFVLQAPFVESTVSDQTVNELRSFLSSHGMVVAGEKGAN
ncbi:MAG TPA: hypothetical protein VKJ45_28375 [Blastocatellia bacterium]|nr:hypothetical protein [Blastocatellia bacterium]